MVTVHDQRTRTVIVPELVRTVLVCVAAALLTAGCAGTPHGRPGTLRVVAAENVYGNIASQIGGSHVFVTSLLSKPNADPHLFEPATADGLAVSTARVVVQNGAGYDAFMARLERAAPNSRRTVLTIADVLGVHGRDANPHLWYDVPRLGAIASAIAGALGEADPAHAAAYRAGLRRFDASLGPLRNEVAAIRSAAAGRDVAATEPVPGYLLAAAGLRDRSPEAFSRAIENGTEPTPTAVDAMTALVAGRRVAVLLYNTQTVSPVTARIRSAARAAGVPVVGVSETLPAGLGFQAWQLGQATALARALGV